jgi:hypothetical protein
MNRRLAAALTIALVAMVAMIVFFPKPPAPTRRSEVAKPTPRSVTPPPENLETRVNHPVVESAALLHDPSQPPEEDLAVIQLLIGEYHRAFGGNPVGENEEITAALTGRNPKGLVFLPADSPAIDSNGRMIDRWGHPLFFHALSARHMEILSAGPDGMLHTDDDLVRDH